MASGGDADILQLTKCDIDPNDSTFEAPVTIALQFDLKRTLPNARWQIQYEVDFTNKRHVVELAGTEPSPLEAGSHTVDLKIPPVDVGGIKERKLLSMGLLRCNLMDKDDLQCGINFVTQVSKTDDGKLIRTMMSPLA
eukprot:Sspe_Gene.112330::Locus_95309_Transcript_1_2_Confidence_0.750_Length_557::g.112330::m.112330